MRHLKTFELSEELSKRDGITVIKVEPYEEIKIKTGQTEFNSTGPAIIIINED